MPSFRPKYLQVACSISICNSLWRRSLTES
ncbi:MucR family transcriptional regulator, partial [Sinorhizobium medicae]